MAASDKAKKKNRSEMAGLSTALKAKEPKRSGGRGGTPPPEHQYKSGAEWRGNRNGRPPDAITYFRKLQERMMLGKPPADLAEELGIDPELDWGEAIAEAIFRSAARGDIAAAREAMAVLAGSAGSSRSQVNVLVNNSGETSISYEFLKHAHGLSPEQLVEVWAFMDALPRQQITIDSSYFPDDSYRELPEPRQLTEGNKENEQ